MLKIVDISEWFSGVSPEIYETTALGPCMGLCLYDKSIKSGYIAHFPRPDSEYSLDILLDQAERDCSSLGRFKATITGMQISPPDGFGHLPKHDYQQREWVVQKLKERGITNISKRFNDKHFAVVTRFYLKSGRVIITPIDEPEDYPYFDS